LQVRNQVGADLIRDRLRNQLYLYDQARETHDRLSVLQNGKRRNQA
jgi:hypothetical protein